MDKSAGSADVLDVVTLEPELVLLFGRGTDFYALKHCNFAVDFLAEKVSDLNSSAIVLDDAIDGEMRVDGSHLVSEAGGDANSPEKLLK